MPSEQKLETVITADMSILECDLFLIGRQVRTDFDKCIDLLAMDSVGKLVVIELKHNKTPREVVAQLLDYGSWVRGLKDEQIASIFDDYLKKYDFVGFRFWKQRTLAGSGHGESFDLIYL